MVVVTKGRCVSVSLLGQERVRQCRVILMVVCLRIYSAAKVEMSSRSAIRSIHSSSVGKDVGQSTLGAELAIALRIVSMTNGRQCVDVRDLMSRMAYFREIFAWSVDCRKIG